DYIAGGAFFLRFLPLPISLAWAAFGEANGTSSLESLRAMIGKHTRLLPGKDPYIGCNLLSEPFFFPRDQWIQANRYMQGPIVFGKGFFDVPEAEKLWREVTERLISNETVNKRQRLRKRLHDTAIRFLSLLALVNDLSVLSLLTLTTIVVPF